MEKRIIYVDEDGAVQIIAPLVGPNQTVEEIAAKDVPAGLPYKIVDATDIPADRNWRADWTVDVADLTDGAGA